MALDRESLQKAGHIGMVEVTGVIRFVAGCMKRERERVARILRDDGFDTNVIDAVLSNTDDEKVFRWAGPETKLDDPIK